MSRLILALCGLLLWGALPVAIVAQQESRDDSLPTVQLEKTTDRVVVSFISGETKEQFTEYRFGNSLSPTKPFLFPVFAADGSHVTRQYPMDESNDDEQTDHPHHKSIWFAHGDVNGIDFWSEKATIANRSVETGDTKITSLNDWMNSETKVCEDQTVLMFGQAAHKVVAYRWIDYRVLITASETDLVFGDTKEGIFAVRTCPTLRLVSKDKHPQATARNSEGVSGKAIWGKTAKWVCYAGEVNGKPVSVAILDHPSNLRHPTTWHAREYGLIAANPFGLHYFQAAENGAGNHRVAKGESLGFRYAVLVIEGKATDALLIDAHQAFSARK